MQIRGTSSRTQRPYNILMGNIEHTSTPPSCPRAPNLLSMLLGKTKMFAKTWRRNSKSHHPGGSCAFTSGKKKKQAHTTHTYAFVHSLTVLYIHSQFLSAASFKSGWVSPQGAEHPQPALMKSQADNTQLGAGPGYYKAHISQWGLHTHQTGSL